MSIEPKDIADLLSELNVQVAVLPPESTMRDYLQRYLTAIVDLNATIATTLRGELAATHDHRDELQRQLDDEARQHAVTNAERKAALAERDTLAKQLAIAVDAMNGAIDIDEASAAIDALAGADTKPVAGVDKCRDSHCAVSTEGDCPTCDGPGPLLRDRVASTTETAGGGEKP